MVGAIGIEPMTSAMSTQRSYQLSYAPLARNRQGWAPSMIPAPPPELRNGRGSDPGYGLGLLARRVLGGLEVVGGHLDPQHALAAVADEVERFGADDLPGNRL